MDIISLPLEFDKDKIDSRFRLVVIAAQRARELSLGARPKVDEKCQKVSTVALLEAVQEKLEFLVGEEARQALEEAKKYDLRKLLEAERLRTKEEELTELERDLRVYLHEREGEKQAELEELFGEQKGEEQEPSEE